MLQPCLDVAWLGDFVPELPSDAEQASSKCKEPQPGPFLAYFLQSL